MTVIDITTKKILYQTKDFSEHIFWTPSKEVWNKYRIDCAIFSKQMERKFLYDEAFAYKPIWPDYDLQYNNLRLGMKSYVRKQDTEGVWQLIPVIMTYEFTKDVEKNEDDIVKAILDNVKRFTEQCYRVLLLWKFPEKGQELTGTNGRPIGGEIDPSQISEKERLYLHINKD